MILRAQDVTQPFWASFLNNDCSETVPIKDRCDPMRVHLCAFWEAVSPSTQAQLIFCVAKQLKEMEKHYISGSHCNLLTTHTHKKNYPQISKCLLLVYALWTTEWFTSILWITHAHKFWPISPEISQNLKDFRNWKTSLPGNLFQMFFSLVSPLYLLPLQCWVNDISSALCKNLAPFVGLSKAFDSGSYLPLHIFIWFVSMSLFQSTLKVPNWPAVFLRIKRF